MKKFITNKYVLTILGCLLFLLIWIITSLAVNETTMIFPDPLSTVIEAGKILSNSYVYECLLWTMLRMVIGFSASFIAALIFGLLAGHFPYLKTILNPTIVALKSIPTAALVFLFLVIVKARYAPIFIVILISFPILYESIADGINNIPEDILDATRVDGSHALNTVLKNPQYDVDICYKLSENNIGVVDNKITIPYYMCMFL